MNKMNLEQVREALNECVTFNVYNVKLSGLGKKEVVDKDTMLNLIEQYDGDKKYKLELDVDDDIAHLYIRRYRHVTECIDRLKDVNCFNIHEYINANQLVGLKRMYRNIKQLEYDVPKEDNDIRDKRVDASKIDWNNVISKYGSIQIIYNDVFDDMIDSLYYYDTDSIIQALEEEDSIVGTTYTKVADILDKTHITLRVYTDDNIVYASDFRNKTDKRFDSYVWSHGLLAYNDKDPVESITGLLSHPEWEVCCSCDDEPIGPVGLYVQGEVQCVSNIDLASRINIFNGRRGMNIEESERLEGVIYQPEDIDKDQWDHTESIIKNIKIVGMWVKDWFLKDDYNIETVRNIKDALGIDEYKVVEMRLSDLAF